MRSTGGDFFGMKDLGGSVRRAGLWRLDPGPFGWTHVREPEVGPGLDAGRSWALTAVG